MITDITDTIQFDNLISDEELLLLIETAGDLIYEYINNDPMIYIQYNFYELVYTSVKDLMTIQFKHLFFHLDDFDLSLYLDNSIHLAFKLFFTHVAPRRSFKNTFIRKRPNVVAMKAKIDYLLSIPQPSQRTTEWYEFRHKYLTASSIWKAFISPSTRNQLIYSKCAPLNVEKYKNVNVDSPLHWGQKYEDLSLKWYEATFNTKVSDFGCIPHKELNFLAASPDGINTDPSSERYGRMVEVKNIVNRDITGIPKTEYWIQMQIQMEVCNLNECDFLETRFTEYDSYDDFIADGSFNKSNDEKHKGIIIMFLNETGMPTYMYPPWNCNQEVFHLWEAEIMGKYSNLTWVKNIYWKLDEISCVLVIRNKFWFNFAKPILIELWNTIEKEKMSGYNHRAPSKRIKVIKCPPQTSETPQTNICFIDTSLLLCPDIQTDTQHDIQHDIQHDTHNKNKTETIVITTEVIGKK
jgi:putative phage-type endonuclease